MVIYTREEKTLIIPEGIGCNCGGGGGGKDCSKEKAIAYESGYTAGYNQGQEDCPECSNLQECEVYLGSDWYGNETITPEFGFAGFDTVVITDTGYGDAKYQSGYTAGQADCSGSSCNIDSGSFGVSDGWGGDEIIAASGSGLDGFSEFRIYDNGYGNWKYNSGYTEGYAAGQQDCPACDCTEAYESGYTEGYQSGTTDGYTDGFEDGYDSGYTAGRGDCPECTGCSLETGSITLTETGGTFYPQTGVGFDSVTIDASAVYQDGYDAGQADCPTCPQPTLENKQFALNQGFTPTTVVPSQGYDGLSGVYVYDNGYGQERYNAGYAAGQADCPTCDCTQAYNDGVTAGTAQQKALLTSTAFTQNGTYARENGWNSVTVNVPQTGSSCNLEAKSVTVTADTQTVNPSQGYDGMSSVVIDAFQYGEDKLNEGYGDGYANGWNDGYTQGQAECPECTGGTQYNVELDGNWDGSQMDILPGGCVGEIIVEDTGYGQAKYDEGYNDGYNEGWSEGSTTSTITFSKDTYFDADTWVDLEDNTLLEEEDIIMIDYKWGSTVTGTNTFILFSNADTLPAVNPPASSGYFHIEVQTAGVVVVLNDGNGGGVWWNSLRRQAQANHSYRLIIQTYSYTSSVTLKGVLIDLTSGQIVTNSEIWNGHYTGGTGNFCINGYYDSTTHNSYEGMKSDWYLGGIKIFDKTGVMKHNYRWLDGEIADIVDDNVVTYQSHIYMNGEISDYSLVGVEETMRFYL